MKNWYLSGSNIMITVKVGGSILLLSIIVCWMMDTTVNENDNPYIDDVIVVEQNNMYILDIGHGFVRNHTCGRGNSAKMHNGDCFYEWKFAKMIVDGLAKKLDKHGIVYKIVDTLVEKRNISVNTRVKLINKIYDSIPRNYVPIVFSIHANAGSKTAEGFEILMNLDKCPKKFTKSDGASQRCYDGHNIVAKYIHDQYLKQFPNGVYRYGKKSNEAKCGGMAILRNTKAISTIIECDFFSNPFRSKVMMTTDYQNKIIDVLFGTIVKLEYDYFEHIELK
jgi:N-acetylmuramoyl-L-alanine amidase